MLSLCSSRLPMSSELLTVAMLQRNVNELDKFKSKI
jgi:hypothetical protein